MIKNVDQKIRDDFASLIPDEYREEIEAGEVFCLGALKEDGDYDLPVGVLLFSVEEGVSDGTEASVMIVLRWFYVAEEYRRQGFANELMEALSDVLDDSPAEGIVCDVPFDSEYDLAEAFLISWGFQFEVTDTNEMIISKDDCRRQIRSKNREAELSLAAESEKPKGIIPVPDVPDEAFRQAVRRAKESERNGYYDLISENREDYAGDMSYAIMHGNEVSSLVLFERLNDSNLHMVMLTSFEQAAAKELLRLLHYTAVYYYLNYPEESKVHLTLGTERSMKLATHLFPDKDPIQVRRGFFY